MKQWIKAFVITIGTVVALLAFLCGIYYFNIVIWNIVIALSYVVLVIHFARQLHNYFIGEVYATVTAKDLMRHFFVELGAHEDTYSKEEKENLSRLIIELNRYNQLHNNPEERIKLVYKAGEK